jgi:hypothetical protein
VLVALEAADRLVCALEQRGCVSVQEAARVLLALPSVPTRLAAGILDEVVRRDARLARRGSAVVLAPSPLAEVPLGRARFAVLDIETSGLVAAGARLRELGIVVLDSGHIRSTAPARPADRTSLAALAEFFDVATRPCHRALPDARATAEIFLALIELAGDRGARTVADLCGLARGRTAGRLRAGDRPASRSAPVDRLA